MKYRIGISLFILSLTTYAMPGFKEEPQEKEWSSCYYTSIGEISRTADGIRWIPKKMPHSNKEPQPFSCSKNCQITLVLRMKGLIPSEIHLDHRLSQIEFEQHLEKMVEWIERKKE